MKSGKLVDFIKRKKNRGVSGVKANSTQFNDICSKDLSKRPIYSVLNTRKLDMILQLKYIYVIGRLGSPYREKL